MTGPLRHPSESNAALNIYRQFRGLIASGYFGAGERLPTVRQAAVDLGVAPGTAAKAYRLLEQDGLVVTRTGAGTRVAETAAVLPRSVVQRIRALLMEVESAGADLDDVIDTLRTIGGAAADAPGVDGPPPKHSATLGQTAPRRHDEARSAADRDA